MSRRFLLIALSLTANVVLAVVWWQRGGAASRRLAEANRDVTESSAETGGAHERSGVATVDWNTISAAGTDAEFVAQLRREGFPPRVIRELLRLRLRGKYAEQLRALERRQPAIPYWRQRAFPQEIDLEARAKLRALN